MSHIQALETEIASLKEEFEKFERGNKSAGTRARKVLQNIKRISQDIRIQIQTAKKTDDKAG
jgi:exonuclease VII small subunit